MLLFWCTGVGLCGCDRCVPLSLADLHTKFSGARPLTGPNSFVFTHIFTEKHPCQRSTPPPPKRVHAPYRKSWISPCLWTSDRQQRPTAVKSPACKCMNFRVHGCAWMCGSLEVKVSACLGFPHSELKSHWWNQGPPTFPSPH